jgi:hypothetical protein
MSSYNNSDSLPQWAAKVAQPPIRRLYESDARGLLDERLLFEVGWALYSRCLSIIMVTNRQVMCPQCQHVFSTQWQWHKRYDQLQIRCPRCDRWEITGAQYRQSFERDGLAAMMALPIFQTYVENWPRATTPAAQMLLIDQLIHAFHWGLKQQDIPHRATANNLIAGSHDAVITFLDQLSYGEASTTELRATYAEWHEHAQHMQQLRQSPRQQRANLLSSKDEAKDEADAPG